MPDMNKEKPMPVSPRAAAAVISLAILTACASSAPVKIGADTYHSSATNTAGMFGDANAVAGRLMAEGNTHCAAMGKEFELVTQQVSQAIPAARMGGASITFKCVAVAGNPVLRPDNGVTTIERR